MAFLLRRKVPQKITFMFFSGLNILQGGGDPDYLFRIQKRGISDPFFSFS